MSQLKPPALGTTSTWGGHTGKAQVQQKSRHWGAPPKAKPIDTAEMQLNP